MKFNLKLKCSKKYAQLLLLGILFCVGSSLQAALKNIIIDGGQVSGIPIAIVPFHSQEDRRMGEDLANIIRADLHNSGQFNAVPMNKIQEFPSEARAVQYPYWQSTGVEDLVIGKLQKKGNTYEVSFELLDVVKKGNQSSNANNNILISQRFDNVSPQEIRALAHHISDIIFKKLIGVRGIFSTRIAYISVIQGGRSAVRTLEVADYDGFNPKPLFRSQYPIMSPTWSPDGKKIAFVSYEKERASINVVDVRSGRVERVAQYPGMNNAPAWSPDNRTLAMVLSKDGGPKIYTFDLSTKQLHRVTDGGGADTEPSFSPDGRSIVFTSDRGGKPQIYRVTLGSGKVERLTFAGSYNAKPSLTPDGKNLVTLHRGDDGLFSIAVHTLGSGGVRVLTQTGLNDSPVLAPNGMMVMYGAQEGSRGILGAVTLDGRLKIRLPAQEGNVQEPAWSPFPS